MVNDRKVIEDALADDRLFVKVDRSWCLATRQASWSWDDNGNWIIRVIAGPERRRGLISRDGGVEDRDFIIIEAPKEQWA